MSTPTPDEIRRKMVDTALRSDALVVATGQKPQWKKDEEQRTALVFQQKRNSQGLFGTVPPPVDPPPPVSPPAVQDLIAKVVKLCCAKDAALEQTACAKFQSAYRGIVYVDPKGPSIDMEQRAPSAFATAVADDVGYVDLMKAGMHDWGDAPGLDTLLQWVRNKTMTSCMPNGDLDDDFLCMVVLLQLDPGLLPGKLEFDEMARRTTVNRVPTPPEQLYGAIRDNVGRTYAVLRGKKFVRLVPAEQTVAQAVKYLAFKATFHAARDWFDALPVWDGKQRFEDFIKDIGAWDAEDEKSPDDELPTAAKNALLVEMCLKFFQGTVARTHEPGCKMDTMLVLKGPQGAGKSSLFEAMAPAGRFGNTKFDIDDKDAYMTLHSCSLYEFQELAGIGKKEASAIKSFISEGTDHFRAPYAPEVTAQKRHTTLVGSTNDDTFLRDPTGTRRFWVIEIDGRIKLAKIKSYLPQLWAEAKARYDARLTCPECAKYKAVMQWCDDHKWWLSDEQDELRARINAKYGESDTVDDLIGDLLSANQSSSLHTPQLALDEPHKLVDIMRLVPELAKQITEDALRKRVVAALKARGWNEKRREDGYYWWNERASEWKAAWERRKSRAAGTVQAAVKPSHVSH